MCVVLILCLMLKLATKKRKVALAFLKMIWATFRPHTSFRVDTPLLALGKLCTGWPNRLP